MSSSASSSSSYTSSSEEEDSSWTQETFYDFGDPVIPSGSVEAKASRKELRERVSLYRQFEQVASEVAKWLIHEKHSKVKFITPKGLGGIAGGDKFIVKGTKQRKGSNIYADILFKFVTDTQLGKAWLYGGNHRNDAIAYKAASNELKG